MFDYDNNSGVYCKKRSEKCNIRGPFNTGFDITPSVASTEYYLHYILNSNKVSRGGGDGGAHGAAGRGDAPGVQGPRHGRDRASVVLGCPTLVLLELLAGPGVHGVWPDGEEMSVLGAGRADEVVVDTLVEGACGEHLQAHRALQLLLQGSHLPGQELLQPHVLLSCPV